MEKLLVATFYDKENKCQRVAKVKYVEEKEYNRLLNEQEQYLNDQDNKEKHLNDYRNNVTKRLEKLESKDFLLAKSLYDNFVDRGLINDDDKFQKDFYDFIFNGCELDIRNTPNDFQIILRKVGNL